MFWIADMIDEFRVICFIFKDGVELVFYLFLSNLAGIKLCTQKICFIY